MGVEVKVKFFASGRELAGTDGLVLQLPEGDSNTESVTRVRPGFPAYVTTPCRATSVQISLRFVLAARW